MDEWLFKHHLNDPQLVRFISGAAWTGADRLIIIYAEFRGYECIEVPAKWRKYKKKAGAVRNRVMAKMLSPNDFFIAFYNGRSSGTKDMIALVKELEFVYSSIVIIETKEKE
jgi:hypothetical protein